VMLGQEPTYILLQKSHRSTGGSVQADCRSHNRRACTPMATFGTPAPCISNRATEQTGALNSLMSTGLATPGIAPSGGIRAHTQTHENDACGR
jgi:hypothetical protein